MRGIIVAAVFGGLAACGTLAGNAALENRGAGGGTGSGGSGGSDATITIGPDGSSDSGYDPAAPYGYLCSSSAQPECQPGHGDCYTQAATGTGPTTDQEDLCKLVSSRTGIDPTCIAMTSVGAMLDGQVCSSALDCGSGLGCVETTQGASVCRMYCCESLEACPAQTYCAPQPMAADAYHTPPLEIPVCIPVMPCSLLEGDMCSTDFGAGLMCTIVRADGTTSCVPIGSGTLDEPCPCAPGYVCYPADNTCKKLCHTGSLDDCPGGICAGGSETYPAGIGICSGGTNNAY